MNPFCGAEDAEEEERGEHHRRGPIHPRIPCLVFTLYMAAIAIFFLTIPNRISFIQQQLLKLWWR
jgi:hypothetical protein